jgi:hypothetical protein
MDCHPITSAAVPQKNAASAVNNSSWVHCFSTTGMLSAEQISSTVARVMPVRMFPEAGVYKTPYFYPTQVTIDNIKKIVTEKK